MSEAAFSLLSLGLSFKGVKKSEKELFKKGSVVIREKRDLILKRMEEKPDTISLSLTKEQVAALSEGSYETVVLHCDVIRDSPFWEEHPDLLD